MVFSTDGEAIIMQEAFNEEVLSGFKEAETDNLKGGPSVSSHHQACDVSPNFRDVKIGVKVHTAASTNTNDPFLQRNLTALFTQFKEEFPSVVLPEGFVTRFTCACEMIVFVMKGKYYNPTKTEKGFIECGQHVKSSLPGQSTVSYDRIMSRTLAKGIEDDELITHADTVARYKEKVVAPRSLYSSPPLTNRTSATSKHTEHEMAEAQMVLDKELKDEAVKQAKEQERARRKALTPQQRRVEDAPKKLKAAAQAAQKVQAKAAKILKAKTVLNMA